MPDPIRPKATVVPQKTDIKGGLRTTPSGAPTIVDPYIATRRKKILIPPTQQQTKTQKPTSPIVHPAETEAINALYQKAEHDLKSSLKPTVNENGYSPEEQTKVNETVKGAMATSAEAMSTYWQSVKEQRAGASSPIGAGSFYMDENQNFVKPDALQAKLESANWKKIEHPDVDSWKGLYAAKIEGGKFGMVSLKDLPDDTELTCINPKQGKFVDLAIDATPELVKNAPDAPVTHMITAPQKDDAGNATGKNVTLTFFPGEVVAASSVLESDLPHGTKISKKIAVEKGWTHAKLNFSKMHQK